MSMPRATNRRMRLGRTAALFLLMGCQASTEVVSSGPEDAGMSEMDAQADAGVQPDAAADAAPDAAPVGEGGTALCNDKPCACDNGQDDDLDGLIDGFDPECTGPFDRNEESFSTGIPSGNPKCDDCFFDDNPNSNDDGCQVAVQCSVDGTASGAPASCGTCQPTGECINKCKPRTPNGCDCFGCCQLPFAGGSVQVKLADGCTMAALDDPISCPPCKRTESECFNPCDRCELCAGKTTLPADCGGSNVCANGRTCMQSSQCGAGEYCAQGCCVEYLY